jgi:hypothetical protein
MSYITESNLYIFNEIPIKITMTFFRGRKSNPKVHMEGQEASTVQSNSKQKSNDRSITIPEFKLYYRAILTKIAWYWHKNRHVEK